MSPNVPIAASPRFRFSLIARQNLDNLVLWSGEEGGADATINVVIPYAFASTDR